VEAVPALFSEETFGVTVWAVCLGRRTFSWLSRENWLYM